MRMSISQSIGCGERVKSWHASLVEEHASQMRQVQTKLTHKASHRKWLMGINSMSDGGHHICQCFGGLQLYWITADMNLAT